MIWAACQWDDWHIISWSSYYTPSSYRLKLLVSLILLVVMRMIPTSKSVKLDKRVVTRTWMTHLWFIIRSTGTASRYKVQMRASEIASLPLELAITPIFSFLSLFFIFIYNYHQPEWCQYPASKILVVYVSQNCIKMRQLASGLSCQEHASKLLLIRGRVKHIINLPSDP